MADLPDGQMLIKSVPANASRIVDGIWIGSAPPIGVAVMETFDCLVLAAIEYQPDPGCFYGVEVISAKINDDGSPMTIDERVIAAQAAKGVIEWIRAGKNILVTCHQGLNRSSLIAALALMKGPHKMQLDTIIESIREARGPNALSNRYFIEFLKRMSNFKP